MYICGGSDGEMLQTDSFIVDFKELTFTMQKNSIENQVAMNKMVYRKSEKTLYSIGGYGSGGMNFCSKLGEEWKEFER